MLGMALLGYIDNFVPVIARDVGLWQFHATRSALVLMALFPLSVVFGWRLMPRRMWAVGLRSFLAAGAMVLYFGAVASLPIAEVAAGLFTSPIFVLLIGWGFLGHKIGPVRILAVVIGFLGVIAILRPDAGGLSAFSLIPVLAGLFWGCAALATRELCADETPATILAGFFLILGCVGGLGLVWFALQGDATRLTQDGFFATGWRPFTYSAFFWITAQAAISGIGVGFLIKAYQLADASHVTVFEYSFLIFAGFWAFVLFGQVPDAIAILGISLIAVSGILIVLRSETSDPVRGVLPEEHS